MSKLKMDSSTIKKTVGHYIDGKEYVDAESEKIDIFNPSTGKLLANLSNASKKPGPMVTYIVINSFIEGKYQSV